MPRTLSDVPRESLDQKAMITGADIPSVGGMVPIQRVTNEPL